MRRGPLGFSVLLAIGMVAAFTLAALLSLTYVTESNAVQGQSRRSKEAFFAAEAGMAEAKERLRIMSGTSSTTYQSLLNVPPPAGVGFPYPPFLPDHPQPVGPNNEWYQLIPETNYGLTRTSVPTAVPLPKAIDDGFGLPNEEGHTATGAEFGAFPTQATTVYRVFLRDDFDEPNGQVQNQTVDYNGRIWIVSIGQVKQTGGRPTQAVITALVSNVSAGGGATSGTSQRISNLSSAETGTPTVTSSITLN